MKQKRRDGSTQISGASIASPIVGGMLMSDGGQILTNTLKTKFDKGRSDTLVSYFSASIQRLEQGDWENSLVKSGKFVEATIKLIWTFAGKTLPRGKNFKAGVYAQKIINGEITSTDISSDGVRLQIPRACIFLYDITSNRGGRHDSDEFTPNEMDAITASGLCSWILAELVRFCALSELSPDEAQKIVESVVKRRYPIFEEIEGRIYVDDKKHKSAIQCALMILYRRFPERMSKKELSAAVMRHNYSRNALKYKRLEPFIDSNSNNNILLRSSGLKRVEEILKS